MEQLIRQNSADVCHSCSGDTGCQRGKAVEKSTNELHLEGTQQKSVSVLECWTLQLNLSSCSGPGRVEKQSVKLLSPNSKNLGTVGRNSSLDEFSSLHYQGEELEHFRLGKISYLSSHYFQLCLHTWAIHLNPWPVVFGKCHCYKNSQEFSFICISKIKFFPKHKPSNLLEKFPCSSRSYLPASQLQYLVTNYYFTSITLPTQNLWCTVVYKLS